MTLLWSFFFPSEKEIAWEKKEREYAFYSSLFHSITSFYNGSGLQAQIKKKIEKQDTENEDSI